MPFERPPNLAAFLEIYLVICSSANSISKGRERARNIPFERPPNLAAFLEISQVTIYLISITFYCL